MVLVLDDGSRLEIGRDPVDIAEEFQGACLLIIVHMNLPATLVAHQRHAILVRDRTVTGPTGLDLDSGAVGGAQHCRGEVVDLKHVLGRVSETRACPMSAALRSEL